MASTVIMALIEKYAEGDMLNNVPRDELIQAIRDLDGNTTKPQKTKKAKKVRDPDAPKRARNAYMVFLADKRESIKESGYKGKEVATEAGKLWKALSDEDKAPYIETSEVEKKQYAEQMMTYRPTITTKVVADSEEFATAPDGWSGPYPDTWLDQGEFKNPETGKKMRFKTFEEAVEAANKFDDCNGITQYPRGFELRKTCKIRTGKYSGKASWIKGAGPTPTQDSEEAVEIAPESTVVVAVAPAPKKKASKKEDCS